MSTTGLMNLKNSSMQNQLPVVEGKTREVTFEGDHLMESTAAETTNLKTSYNLIKSMNIKNPQNNTMVKNFLKQSINIKKIIKHSFKLPLLDLMQLLIIALQVMLADFELFTQHTKKIRTGWPGLINLINKTGVNT